jgi:dihydrofolate reductase
MKTSKLVVMGSNTYNTDQALPEAGRLVVVMTSKPENYKRKEVPHQVEFTSRSPQQLVERYSYEGYEEMMVVGGTQVATSFLKEGLIDEIWLTLEPKIFGTGGNFAMAENLDISLKLLNINQVNEQGTFILKYEVVKTKNF